MFPRPALHTPVPVNPAGFRIADYFSPKRCFNLFRGPDPADANSAAPSPLNSSPTKGSPDARVNVPPAERFANLRAGVGIETPQSPTATPASDDPQNAMPRVPPSKPHRHKAKRLGPNGSASRVDALPPRHRAKELKEKRLAARKKCAENHERRLDEARKGINDLRWDAENLMQAEHMNEEDKIFMEQLRNLQHNDMLNIDLEKCRERMSRANRESGERRREHKRRDEEAAKMQADEHEDEAERKRKKRLAKFERAIKASRQLRMEKAAMRVEERRQREHQAAERRVREEQERVFREEQALKAKKDEERRKEQQRLREEDERRLRDMQRWLEEQKKRWLQEEKNRRLREEVEKLRRETQEREEKERQARFLAEQARRAAVDEQIRRYFFTYEGKWTELWTSDSLPPINLGQMPWPVFRAITSADQIRYQDVREFLFHPLRPGLAGKTVRDTVKTEMLRFHPDKFDSRVVPKIQPSQQTAAQEIAGAVTRILTTIMAEGGQQ